LVIGETKIEIRERHGEGLDLDNISKRILPALQAAVRDRSRIKKWQSQKVAIDAVAGWANDHASQEWGKKAARDHLRRRHCRQCTRDYRP
jgi:hypothetical protein